MGENVKKEVNRKEKPFALSDSRQPCSAEQRKKQTKKKKTLCLFASSSRFSKQNSFDDLARIPCSGAKRCCKVGLLHHNYLAARLSGCFTSARHQPWCSRDIRAMNELREGRKTICGDVVSFSCRPEDDSESEKAEKKVKNHKMGPGSRVDRRTSCHCCVTLRIFYCIISNLFYFIYLFVLR